MELLSHTKLLGIILITKEVLTKLPEKYFLTKTKRYITEPEVVGYTMLTERVPPKGIYYMGPKVEFFDIYQN